MTTPMKAPMIEKPVLKTSVGLHFEIKRRFKMNVNENGERKRVNDDLQFRRDFEEMAKMIPNWKGTLVVIGFNGNNSKIIELIQSEGSLRGKLKAGIVVKDGVSMSRYQWYKSMLYNEFYSSIKIQMIS